MVTNTMQCLRIACGLGLSTWGLGLIACGTDHVTLRSSEETGPGAQDPPLREVPPPSLVDSPRDVNLYPTLPSSRTEQGITGLRPPLVPTPTCKIDFLFVIDDSSSMRAEQANLVRSFPGFVQVMQQIVEAQDLHIMVVGTGGQRADDDEPALEPEECDEVQGAGRRLSLEGADCGIQTGLRYMADDQPNLAETFACVAQVGTDGSLIEEPMDAVLAATSQTLNLPGRCNSGFLRDDAILVTFVITDEDDRRSSGDPEDWRELLLGVKRGDDSSLVVLGLVGDNNVEDGLLGGKCSRSDADGAPRLQSFVSSMGGLLGSVCAPDYTPFFQTAAGAIDSACADLAARALP